MSSTLKSPAQIEADHLRILFDNGHYFELETRTRQLIEQFPDSGLVWKALGASLQMQGKEALPVVQKAAQLLPDDASAQSNLGRALRDAGQLAAAATCFRRAIEIKPDLAEAHNNLGATMKDLGKLDEAIDSYRRALTIKPDFTLAHNNLGLALRDRGQFDAALESFRRALEIDPDLAPAYIGMGITLEDVWQLDDAVASFRQAFKLNPNSTRAMSNLLCSQHYLTGSAAGDLLLEARRFGDLAAQQARAYTHWTNNRDSERCLRIGLVSPDFRNHPVGYFIENVLKELASSAGGRLEILGYMTNTYSDALTERIKTKCHAFITTEGLTIESLARRIRDDRIDILIDLSGHTAHNCLPFFAWKPAPVQVSWLGYFATTGLETMDYIIADPWTLPAADEHNFTEKIWRLPETRLCFTPPNVDVPCLPLPALTHDCFTFGCFNNLSKLNDSVIALWARVLRAVPGSRLFLKTKQLGVAKVRQRVVDCFAANGIDADRLELEGFSPRAEYLAAYQRVDLALDPFPFPGGTTTVESLWMGVPVLTMAGSSFLSRQGVGILMNVGLPDWIANDADDYVARAVLHSGDLNRLAALRERLRQQVLDSPLFDALRFASHFEAALRGMWREWCSKPSLPSCPEESAREEADQLVGMFHAGRYSEVEARTRNLIEKMPNLGIAWKLLGASLQVQGKDSLTILQQAARLLPDDAEAQNNLGVALVDCGKPHEAIARFQRALEINPDYAGAHNSLGAILKVMGHLDDAVSSLRRAIQIDPGFVQAHINLGTALQELGRLDDAVASYRRALEISPDDADAHNNLGTAMNDLGRLEDAVASYRTALKIRPDYAEVHSNLLFIHNYLANRSGSTLLAEARRFGDLASRKASRQTAWPNSPDPDRCLRVGLVSGDLRTHPVGHFVDDVLTALSSMASGRLELFGYANHSVTDELTERIKACCRGWYSAVGVSDESLARRIRDDGIDVLIDLIGHTAHNRLTMFAWKPAPVQVSWLGYFATTGVTEIDYLLADPWTLPDTEEAYFTEKIWRLPETRLCFTPPDVNLPVAPLPALSNGYVTFGCFNNLTKMNDSVVELWAKILTSVSGSRLLLKATQLNGNSTRNSVTERFAAKGISADRLLLEGSSSRETYLAAYNQVDIALDPFPYPGGATTAECLWMGVPVLTLAGTSFLSRQGVGLLMNAGLPDWIAGDTDDYVSRAVSHAADLSGMAGLRARLRRQVIDSPIFDAQRFARHFETALRGMWIRYCAEQSTSARVNTQALAVKTFLHVGCGINRKQQTTRGFDVPEWKELRLDIDAAVNPDIVGTMLDMTAVADESVDALFSHHNIEHLYSHEVPVALAEFWRVLKPDGFAVIACPDLQSVCRLIAEDKLTEPACMSSVGPIAPIDMVYGHRAQLVQGNHYMAHHCGFTEKTLVASLQQAGFGAAFSGSRDCPSFDLWVVASKGAMAEDVLARLADAHFPE